jgi:PAS domain-containing protein
LRRGDREKSGGAALPVIPERALALTLPGGAVRHNSSRLTAADLRASEARYQTLADHSPSGVVLLAGRSLQILDRNTAASKLTGYAHQESLRMRVIALAPEPRRAGAAASFAASTNDASDHGSDAHLPAMPEFGSAASALLALHLQAEALTSHRRAEI